MGRYSGVMCFRCSFRPESNHNNCSIAGQPRIAPPSRLRAGSANSILGPPRLRNGCNGAERVSNEIKGQPETQFSTISRRNGRNGFDENKVVAVNEDCP